MVEGTDVNNAGDHPKHFDAGDNEQKMEITFSYSGNEHLRADCTRKVVVQLPGPGP